MDYEEAAGMVERAFTQILGEPVIEGIRGEEKGGRRDFHTDQVDEVFREILQVRAEYTLNLPADPVLHLTHELMNKFMLYANK